jgi:hypothetical protein
VTRGVSGKTIARLFAVIIAAPTLTGPARAAQSYTPIPDLSGFWGRNSLPYETPSTGLGPVENASRLSSGARDRTMLVGDTTNPILTPQAAQIVKRFGEISRSGKGFPDPQTQCWPQSPPYILRAPATQIVQRRDQMLILYQNDHQVRHIFLNEAHPAHVTPSWYGHSVGHFEGDTLVVDTVGIKVGPFSMIDRFGTPYSESLHLVERFRLIDIEAANAAMAHNERLNGRLENASADPNDTGKGLQIRFTVEDPNFFTAPWSANVTYRRNIDLWVENVCAENLHNYGVAEDPDVPVADRPDF